MLMLCTYLLRGGACLLHFPFFFFISLEEKDVKRKRTCGGVNCKREREASGSAAPEPSRRVALNSTNSPDSLGFAAPACKASASTLLKNLELAAPSGSCRWEHSWHRPAHGAARTYRHIGRSGAIRCRWMETSPEEGAGGAAAHTKRGAAVEQGEDETTPPPSPTPSPQPAVRLWTRSPVN